MRLAKAMQSLNLRQRLTLLVVGVVTTVMLISSGTFIWQLERNLSAALRNETQALRAELTAKGNAIVRNIALTSGRAIVVGNLAFLVEVMKTSVGNDASFTYGIIMDNDRRAIVHTDARLANQVLNGPSDLFASKQDAVQFQEVKGFDHDVLEAVAPIFVDDERWGVVRIGMSMQGVQNEIKKTELAMREQIQSVTNLSLGIAGLLLAIGMLFGVRGATSIVGPLSGILKTVEKIQSGDMTAAVKIRGAPEFLTLASAFNNMIFTIKQRESALEQALQEAQTANRLKSEFLANVSHELRTPLNAIINLPQGMLKDYTTRLLWYCKACNEFYEPDTSAEMPGKGDTETCPECSASMALTTVAKSNGDDSEHYSCLQRTVHSSQHLLSVVTDILDFSKLEAGKMQLNYTDVELLPLCRSVGETIESLAVVKQLRIDMPVSVPQPSVWADSVKLAQILINLLGNAVKFTPEGGTVGIRVRQSPDGMALFDVFDTGIGIPSDKLELIFESFRQVDGSHTRAHGGTGLGLSITRKLVDIHGGKIWAESVLGQGTHFYFTMPWQHPDAKAAEHPVDEGKHVAGRILVVEDDPVQSELIASILLRDGHKVRCVLDPANFAEALQEVRPNVIMLDIMMPGTSGITLVKNLRSSPEYAHVQIIVSSAYHANQDLVEGLDAQWLAKPWSPETLLARIDKALKSSQGARVETGERDGA